MHCAAPQAILHGDFKAPNCFFKRLEKDELSVGLIDFQWSGSGLCATDLAYCVLASIRPSDARNDTEVEMMTHYHSCLMQALVDVGVVNDLAAAARTLPQAQLKHEYEIAFLDICRAAIGGQWNVDTLDTLKKRQSLQDRQRLVFNAYNKSVPVAMWMLERMGVYMGRHADL